MAINENDIDKERLEEYREANESQLNNVLSSPIGTGDYSMPSVEEADEIVFLEGEIEATEDLLDLFDEEGEVMKKFFWNQIIVADINRINTLIDKYFDSTGLNRAEANEISLYLEKNGVLSHSTKGQPLRELLREGKIPNAEQPGGKWKTWYINRRTDVTDKPIQLLEPKAIKSIELTSEAITEGLEPVADPESEFLILGTLPGKVSLQTRQYYANHSNYFWRIISSIFNEAVPDSYEGKLDLLKKHHIALWDVLKSADRESSLDSNIKNPFANDILEFISTHPDIRVIGLNGKAAEAYFRKLIGIHNLPENVRVVSLPSSSSSNTHLKLDTKISLWNLILKS